MRGIREKCEVGGSKLRDKSFEYDFFFDVFAYGSGVESIHGVICRMVLLREGL